MADEPRRRRQRLHELIDLARGSHQWSRARLARALGRDASRLYPDSASPKLDFLTSLAEVLGWPLSAVIEYVWRGFSGGETDGPASQPSGGDFDELLDATREAFRHGRYRETIMLARRLQAIARTPTERAMALGKEANGLSCEGRVDDAIAVGRRLLAFAMRLPDDSLMFQVNYADSLIDAEYHYPALGIAERASLWYREHPAESLREHMIEAFSHYLRGRAFGRLIDIESELRERNAVRALEAMRISREMHLRIADIYGCRELKAIAATCRAGIVEAEVELGRRDAEDAVAEIIASLPTTLDDPRFELGDWLESCGWWCVTGARLALRHLEGPAMSRALAILNNKALEIADRIDNWLFRQHVLRIRYEAHCRMVERTGLRIDWLLDDEDMRLIVGVMGRSSQFRELGWRMLREAGRAAG